MRAIALALILLTVAGCVDPPATGGTPAPPPAAASLAVTAANNGTVPVWFRLSLVENGTTREPSERMVTGGASTEWRHAVAPGSQVEYRLDYRTDPAGTAGFGTSGRTNTTACPGTFRLDAWAETLHGGPQVAFRFRTRCA